MRVHYLENIRSDIRAMVGLPVEVCVGNGGRRALTCQGCIDATYANVFTVQAPTRRDKLCFSYSDVLTRNVVFTPLVAAERVAALPS